MDKSNEVIAIELKELKSDSECMREVLEELAYSPTTPADIFDSKFGKIEKRKREAVSCKFDVSLDYTASIGYDKTEEYYEKVKKYDGNREYYVDEKRTRTVTQWSPYSGHIDNSYRTFVYNDNEKNPRSDFYNDRALSKLYLSTKDIPNSRSESRIIIKDGIIQRSSEVAKECVFKSVVFPGDRQKDTKYVGRAILSDQPIIGYVVPEYRLQYSYQGKEYNAYGYSTGKVAPHVEMPDNATDVKKLVRTKMLPIWLSILALYILSIVLTAVVNSVFMVLGFVAVAMTVITLVVIKPKILAKVEKTLQQKKLKDLQTYIKNHRLSR